MQLSNQTPVSSAKSLSWPVPITPSTSLCMGVILMLPIKNQGETCRETLLATFDFFGHPSTIPTSIKGLSSFLAKALASVKHLQLSSSVLFTMSLPSINDIIEMVPESVITAFNSVSSFLPENAIGFILGKA